MSAQYKPEQWQCGRVAYPHEPPLEMYQPLTTTAIATKHDPCIASYNQADGTFREACASIPTARTGPKEPYSCEGHITCSLHPAVSHGRVKRLLQQQPNVMLFTQKVQSQRPVPEGNRSAQKNCQQNSQGPASQCGRRSEELQRVAGNSAMETALSVPTHPLPHSFGPRESSPIAQGFGTAQHQAAAMSQATNNKKVYTDALIHDLIAERLRNMRVDSRDKGFKDAKRTHCWSFSSLGLQSEQNTSSSSLEIEDAACLQFTSPTSPEAVGLSLAGNAGSSAPDSIWNKQPSTTFGKGILEEHAELTRNVEKQDPSIHPSMLVRLSGAGSRWQPAKQHPPGFLHPSHTLQFFLGDPEAFPGQTRYIIPPAGSGSAPGSPPKQDGCAKSPAGNDTTAYPQIMMTTAIIPKNDFPTEGDAQEHKKATPKASSKMHPCDSPHTEVLHVESTGVSQCDSEGEDSCVDWVLSPLSIPDLKFVDGSRVTLAKTKSYSAKSPRAKTLSDSVEICVDNVRGKTHLTIPPEAKCSPIESDDCEQSVRFMKGPTKSPTNRTSILKGLKSLVAGRTNRKRRRAKCLSSSESEDGRDDLPVLQKGSRVKEPPQILHDSEINEEYPCIAGAEECVSNCRLPRYSFQMPHDQIEPLKLVKLNYTLSQEMKKTIQGNLDNRHPRKKMRDRKIPSDTCTMLGLNMDPEINALNTGHHVMPSKPTSVSKEHLIMLKELKSAAHQKNTNNATASTEPSRMTIARGTELSRAASAGGTASGRKPCRDASASGHATPSPMETSPSSTYSRCLTTTSRKRISHYPKEQASPPAQHMASSGDSISRSTNNNSDSKHQKPCSQQGPSTSPASRSQKEHLNSSKIPSKPGQHHFPSKQGTSSETTVSAREQVKNKWQSTNFLKDPEKQQKRPRKELKHSSVPEGHQHISTSKAASVSKPNNAGKWAGMELHSNVAKQKDTSFKWSIPTTLVTRARIQAKEWTRATHREGLNKTITGYPVGGGFKWGKKW